ncbi:MAG: bifunctional 4-hydroxy-2-oxoglutarate aldolase/2-dehydro-3-deoxy-phosphogluconate aldolase [Burkholderiales bacterium]
MTLLDLFEPSPASPIEPAAPVIPVIVLEDARHAVPLAHACVAGGVRVLEVTLRTPAGLEAIRRIAAEVPDAWVGAGTVTSAADVGRVAAVGARFAVSPGFDRSVAAAARDLGLPLMPGVMTPSEAMAAMAVDLTLLKFFPAAAACGLPMLKALSGPFPGLRFCPTGGVDARNAAEYLALDNVVAVGGSWLTPPAAIAREDWAAITTLARAAASLRAARVPA